MRCAGSGFVRGPVNLAQHFALGFTREMVMAVESGGIGGTIRAIGGGSRRALAAVVQPVFGSWNWEPPRWWQFIARKCGAGSAWLRQRPRLAAGGALGI